MKKRKLDTVLSFFKREKFSFWFDLLTDEERKLKRMSAFELAEIIIQERECPTYPAKRIVANHMLRLRVAKIQSNATYVSGFIGLL